MKLGLNRIYLYTLGNKKIVSKIYLINSFIYEEILRKYYFCH